MSTTVSTHPIVGYKQAQSLCEHTIKAGLVPFLQGSPGCGKSSLFRDIANKYNLYLIDLRLSQCEPMDLMGLPFITQDGRTDYHPMRSIPLESDPIPEGYSGFLLLLDELPGADRDVQKACYKLLLDRKINQTPVHKKCAIVAAGNLITDNALVEELSTAIQSRLIHFQIELTLEDWLKWGYNNQIDKRILAFVQANRVYFNNFDPDHTDYTYACARTWEFLSKLIKNIPELSYEEHIALIAGAVGLQAASHFLTYQSVGKNLPTVSQIVNNPAGTSIPTNAGELYMLSVMLVAETNETNLDNILKYVTRMPREFMVVIIRGMLSIKKNIPFITKSSEFNNATQGLIEYIKDL